MKAKQIFEKLFAHWPAKILCFVMALLLYFFYQVSQMNTKAIPVKLTVSSDGLLMPVNSYPKHVRVTVRTSPEYIAKITEDGITAELNISNYVKPGEYKVPVNIDFSSDLLLIEPLEVHVTPDTIPLTLEEKVFTNVKVTPVFEGSLPPGYETGNISVFPKTVRISGPASIIGQIKELQTDKVDLSDYTASFSQQAKLVRNTSLINIEDKPSVSVSVEVKPVQQEMAYSDIPVYFTYLPHHLQVAGTVPVVSFKVSGIQSDLGSLNVDNYTVQADCSSVTQPGEYELPLSYLLPSTVTVVEKSAETVKVQIVQKPKEPSPGQKP
jgi:YbbR domain-containing protein